MHDPHSDLDSKLTKDTLDFMADPEWIYMQYE